jgi:hypothetical protein
MNKWALGAAIFLTFAAKSLDDEVIENLDFLENMEMMTDEDALQVAQEENLPEDEDDHEDN